MRGDALPLVLPLEPAPHPVETCARFLDLPYLALLDSSAAGTGEAGRYSFLTADPAYVIRSRAGRTERLASPGGAWTPVDGDALGAVRDALAPFAAPPVPGLPPFQGGALGYIGYETGTMLEHVPRARRDDHGMPDLVMGVYDWAIAWDHRLGQAWLVSTGLPDRGAARTARAEHRMAMVLGRMADGHRASLGDDEHRGAMGDDEHRPYGGAPAWAGLRSTFTHAEYLAAVTRVRSYILAGDIFQANLSQRFEAPLAEPPFRFYRRLRQRNPAPFGAYLAFGDDVVASVSPERFMRLDVSGGVETRPIKGTRPRGTGAADDAALAAALEASEKDRAENVMIVDLLRNDLSRVCEAGSVRVPSLCALESHPTVHHLVSTVVGRLAPGADAVDLLRATFPGGSVTGAPKIRAMEIIAELEPTTRGVYCGAVGYLGLSGALDTSIAIRTCIVTGGRVHVQAGGAVVADSEPEEEYQETLAKARGILQTIAAGGEADAT